MRCGRTAATQRQLVCIGRALAPTSTLDTRFDRELAHRRVTRRSHGGKTNDAHDIRGRPRATTSGRWTARDRAQGTGRVDAAAGASLNANAQPPSGRDGWRARPPTSASRTRHHRSRRRGRWGGGGGAAHTAIVKVEHASRRRPCGMDVGRHAAHTSASSTSMARATRRAAPVGGPAQRRWDWRRLPSDGAVVDMGNNSRLLCVVLDDEDAAATRTLSWEHDLATTPHFGDNDRLPLRATCSAATGPCRQYADAADQFDGTYARGHAPS